MESSASVSWRFDATEHSAAKRARFAFTSYLQEHCTADSDILGAEIVFSELISNAFRHGSGPVGIWMECAKPDCTLNVHDLGEGFELGNPSLPEDVLSDHGRGLFLVCTLSKRVQVIRIPEKKGAIVRALLPVSFAA
ncbi:MAG: hypothetical protein NVS9B12_13420 [Vulcanimicrobiaceae bacterium]